MQPTIGLEKMLSAAIAAAIRPFQEDRQAIRCAVAQLQSETQCGLRELVIKQIEDIEKKSDSAVAVPGANMQKNPELMESVLRRGKAGSSGRMHNYRSGPGLLRRAALLGQNERSRFDLKKKNRRTSFHTTTQKGQKLKS